MSDNLMGGAGNGGRRPGRDRLLRRRRGFSGRTDAVGGWLSGLGGSAALVVAATVALTWRSCGGDAPKMPVALLRLT